MKWLAILALGVAAVSCRSTDPPAASLQEPDTEAEPSASEVEPAESQAATATPPPVEDSSPVVDPPGEQLTMLALDPNEGALREQLMSHARAASEDGKRVYVELSATWCAPCKRVHALLSEPDVAASLGGVVLLEVDTDKFGTELNPLGFTSKMIPAVYEVDKRGRPSGRTINGHRWRTAENVRAELPGFLAGRDSAPG